MKESKITKRSLLFSVLSMVICVAMLAGTTFAWFTDTASAGVNRIQAGILDIDLLMKQDNGYVSIAGGSGDIFREALTANNSNATLWEPGKTQIAKLAVENKGNLALKYVAYIDVTDEGLVGSLEYAMVSSKTEIDTSGYANWEAVKTAVVAAGGATGDVQAGRVAITTGILDEIVNGTQNERDYVLLVIHMKETAGNEYQGKDALIDVNIVASQKDAEYDTFNNTYDISSILPTVAEHVNGTGSTKGIRKSATNGMVTEDKETEGVGDAKEKVEIEIKMDVKTDSATETKTIAGATVPAPAAIAVMDSMFTAENGFEAAPDPEENQTVKQDDVLVLTMNVETVEVTTESITIDVLMNALATRKITIQETGKDDQISSKELPQSVSELTQPVTVEINLDKGLEEVKVTHTHGTEAPVAMVEVDSIDNLADGKFYYDKANGKLTLMTSKFSEFKIEYVSPFYAKIGSVMYYSLDEAVEAYQTGDVIVLMKDIPSATINKNVTISSNGAGLTAEIAKDKTLSITDGTFSALTITGEGDCVITGGTFGVNPSAYVPSGYVATKDANENKWTVAKVDYGKYFAGGKGTAAEPYLIESAEQLQNIGIMYEADIPAYFKMKNEGMTIDCTGWTRVNLYGSFDGNGATFKNVATSLFGYVIKPSDMSDANLLDFNVNAKVYDGEPYHFGPVAYFVWGGPAELKDINVHGYVEAPCASSFVGYGYKDVTELKFTNCYSDASIVGTSGGTGGFIAHPYGTQKIVLNDSLFTGTMTSNGQPLGYINRNFMAAYEINYSAEFLTAHSFANADAVKTAYYNNTDLSDVNGPLYTAAGKTSTLVSATSGTLPGLGSVFSVEAKSGAVSAKAILIAAPNKPADANHSEEWGNFTCVYMAEELTLNQGYFTTSEIKQYNVRVNPTVNPASTTGPNGTNFDIINSSMGTTLFSNPVVKLFQYDANGCIIAITDWEIN